VKVDVAAVISLDGKMTRHGEKNFAAWASQEDHQHFRNLIREYDVLVMGRGTYEATLATLKLDDRLRVVLTSKADKFKSDEVPGKLEFRTIMVSDLVRSLDTAGHKRVLIVGGGEMISDFIRANLVDEIYLTLEPRLFGSGNSLAGVKEIDAELQLLEETKLNDQGTLLLKYKVVK
jgi:dihydrofolate reductase